MSRLLYLAELLRHGLERARSILPQSATPAPPLAPSWTLAAAAPGQQGEGGDHRRPGQGAEGDQDRSKRARMHATGGGQVADVGRPTQRLAAAGGQLPPGRDRVEVDPAAGPSRGSRAGGLLGEDTREPQRRMMVR